MFVITHQFVDLKPDGTDASVVRPSDWNNSHTLSWLTSTVASLPIPIPAGRRYFVTDAQVGAFGSIVLTGGSTKYPVYADGTNWRIG